MERRKLANLAAELLEAGGALESTGSGKRLDAARVGDALASALEAEAPSLEPAERERIVRSVVEHGEEALRKTRRGAADGELTRGELASLEAIVHAVGRPAVRFVDGRIGLVPTDAGRNSEWIAIVGTARSRINAVAASVARVRGMGRHIGTAWRVGGDRVVTNRHVARHLVRDPGAPPADWRVDADRGGTLEFVTPTGSSFTRPVEELVFCAPEPGIDLAVLRLTDGVEVLPPPLAIVWDGDGGGLTGTRIYVVGHPYRPDDSDPIERVFGIADGSKRWCPGLVVGARDELSLEHDCSTLGGNSGSCVVAADTHEVLALHFGAFGVDEASGAGLGNLALLLSGLAGHASAQSLQSHATGG